MLPSTSEIVSRNDFRVSSVLNHPERYFAHVSYGGNTKETLEEHTDLVLDYFSKLVEANGIDPLLDELIINHSSCIPGARNDLPEFLKTAYTGAVFFHDMGKINPGFQSEKMGNAGFFGKTTVLGTTHAKLGTYLYLESFVASAISEGHFDASRPDIKEMLLLFYLIAFSYPARQHHGHLFSLFEDQPFTQAEISEILHIRGELQRTDDTAMKLVTLLAQEHFWRNLKARVAGIDTGIESLHVSVKLLFSLLTAADYYATNRFMAGIGIDDFGILTDDLKNKIKTNLYAIEYNKVLADDSTGNGVAELDSYQEFSLLALNGLRGRLAAEVLRGVRENKESNFYYLEAPTGSGKTNMSLLLASKIMDNDPRIRKLFYVFPFTTLATQTIKVMREALNLSESEAAELHSRSLTGTDTFGDSRNEDSAYGQLKTGYLTGYFYNYPVLVTSHVRFFNILLSNRKNNLYGLHRLANSVVIIDEIQGYDPKTWGMLVESLNFFGTLLNIRFIVMSATLPKIGKLLTGLDDPFVDLVKERAVYFGSRNFAGRVEYDPCLLETDRWDLEKFTDEILVITTGEMKSRGVKKVLVEFVSKKEANQFYANIRTRQNSDIFDDIFLLNGYILEPRRRDLITRLKSKNSDKVLVVATQVIEAGVDIDMDLGFKDKAMPDTDEQFAGRVNRNASKAGCKVYLFSSDKAGLVYRGDTRYEVCKNQLTPEEYLQILTKKNFEKMYDRVLQYYLHIDNLDLADNLKTFRNNFRMLDFLAVSQAFKLIDSDTVQVFVPIEIESSFFTEKENATIKLLLPDYDGKLIKGEMVFSKFQSLLRERMDDFVLKNAMIKAINSVISFFTFNVYRNSSELRMLQPRGEFYGDIFYLNDYQDVYSFEDGLTIEDDNNTDGVFI